MWAQSSEKNTIIAARSWPSVSHSLREVSVIVVQAAWRCKRGGRAVRSGSAKHKAFVVSHRGGQISELQVLSPFCDFATLKSVVRHFFEFVFFCLLVLFVFFIFKKLANFYPLNFIF